jgi:predicted HAD superfamily phosphohydrolase YqeG
MTVPHRTFTDPSEVTGLIADSAARTVIFDVEPLIAFWDTDRQVLDEGVAAILARLGADPGEIRHVLFATNSARRPAPATFPALEGIQVDYLALARKPLRTAPYRNLPTPGVVIGDQIATDGVLAWRLGYTFLRYTPDTLTVPLGPRIMGGLGRPLHTLLFHNS